MAFLRKIGLEEIEQLEVLEPEDIERLKAEADEIADRAIKGYLASKKTREERLANQKLADSKKRKGKEPEELRERLRAIRESIGEPGSSSR